jgi:hypothetical protein
LSRLPLPERQTSGRDSAIGKAAADSASYLSLCRTAAAALRQTPGMNSAITAAAANGHEYPLASTLEREGERSGWSPKVGTLGRPCRPHSTTASAHPASCSGRSWRGCSLRCLVQSADSPGVQAEARPGVALRNHSC